jgi:hypothetical protein
LTVGWRDEVETQSESFSWADGDPFGHGNEPGLRFVILPSQGLGVEPGPANRLLTRIHDLWETGQGSIVEMVLRQVDNADVPYDVVLAQEAEGPERLRIIDSVFPNGPKLVELTPSAWRLLRYQDGPLTVAQERGYFTQSQEYSPQGYSILPYHGQSSLVHPVGGSLLTVDVRDQTTHQPLEHAHVVVFVDYANSIGDESDSNSAGIAQVEIGMANALIERLYVEPPYAGYWGAYLTNILAPSSGGIIVDLAPVDGTILDVARQVYGTASSSDGSGVTIAIVDNGVDDGCIRVVSGSNVLPQEYNQWGDNSTNGHGTHIAAIIGAYCEHLAAGVKGLATGADLHAFRVYGELATTATSYAILAACVQAVERGCDLINLSIGQPHHDPTLDWTDAHVNDRGTVMLCAAGNTCGGAVYYPAACKNTLSVAAYGRSGWEPKDVLEKAYVTNIVGLDQADSSAFFSAKDLNNIDIVSPGVGILSLMPKGGIRPWSGTSQACAVATAIAARILQGSNELAMSRGPKRSAAMRALIMSRVASLGFPLEYEGNGRIS